MTYGGTHWPCNECERRVACEDCDDELLLEPLLDFLCWWHAQTAVPFTHALDKWVSFAIAHDSHICDECMDAHERADYELALWKEETCAWKTDA